MPALDGLESVFKNVYVGENLFVKLRFEINVNISKVFIPTRK